MVVVTATTTAAAAALPQQKAAAEQQAATIDRPTNGNVNSDIVIIGATATEAECRSEVRSSEPDDDLEVDDDFPYELLEDPDEVNDVLELADVLELHFILVKLTSN